jgi:hypothetical protein
MSASKTIVTLEDYSMKAVAIFGKIGPYKAAFDAKRGMYNPALNHNGARAEGWIFPKARRAEAERLVKDINDGTIKPGDEGSSIRGAVSQFSQPSQSSASSAGSAPSGNFVEKKAHMALVSRVEQLEPELALIKKTLKLPASAPAPRVAATSASAPSQTPARGGIVFEDAPEDFPEDDDEDDDEDADEEVEPAGRLMHAALRRRLGTSH